jgi:hypothetical protein
MREQLPNGNNHLELHRFLKLAETIQPAISLFKMARAVPPKSENNTAQNYYSCNCNLSLSNTI